MYIYLSLILQSMGSFFNLKLNVGEIGILIYKDDVFKQWYIKLV